MWVKKDTYYYQNDDWTICRTGIETVKYGLWHKQKCLGWFNSSKDAITHWKKLNDANNTQQAT